VACLSLAREFKISSTVLVQVNGLRFVFQVAIHALMSFSSAWTEVWTPRRISFKPGS